MSPLIEKYLLRTDATAAAASVGSRCIHEVVECVEADGRTTHNARLLLHANINRRQSGPTLHIALAVSRRTVRLRE